MGEEEQEGHWEEIKKGYLHELRNKVSISTTATNESHPAKASQGTETQAEKETQRPQPQASSQPKSEEQQQQQQQQQGQQEPPEKEEWSEEEWEAPEEPPESHNDLWWEQRYWEIEREAEHFRRGGTVRVTWKNWLACWAISGVVVVAAVWLGLRARVTAGKLWEIGTGVDVVRAWAEVWRREMDARGEVVRAWVDVWRGRVEALRDWLGSL